MREFLLSAWILITAPLCLTLLGGAAASAEIIPAAHRTTWSPGIPGGIPARTEVCATVEAGTYLNGLLDATAGIQAGLDACPDGQVVQLSAGLFVVNGEHPLTIGKSVVLRGAGAGATNLRRTNLALASPVVLIGRRWPEEAGSFDLAADAPRGATSVRVSSTSSLSVGQLVLVDETTDDSYVYWGVDPAVSPGGEGRGWFTRYDRPVGQMLEIAVLDGDTVSFTTPLHIAFHTAHGAQLTAYTVPYGATHAGLEDLSVHGGQDDNITLRLARYSWVRGVESEWSIGDSIDVDSSFRCVVRDSYFHDTPNPTPGGAGYLLAVDRYTADTLVENNIFVNGNKVMVMRASGGGNVIAYNYFDNGYISYVPEWMETGLNASHMTCPHFELFEGNLAFNIDGDDTWGGAVSNTFFRNHATGRRHSFPDLGNRRAVGLMYGHYNYNFVGNVLGTADQSPFPYGGFAYEDYFPWEDDPIGLWRLGYTPQDWDAPPDPRVVATTHRHGNFDYATRSVQWAEGFDRDLPSSLYLSARPGFFGDAPWPWVDPTSATPVQALPAKVRFDAGRPLDSDLIFADGFQSGNLSRWSGSARGGGDLEVSPAAAMALTANGLRAVVGGWRGPYVQDDSPRSESRFQARFYFDPNGFEPGQRRGQARTRIFAVYSENPTRRVAAVVLRREAVGYGLAVRCRLDNGRQAESGFFPITDGPHQVELAWSGASSPVTPDGSCRLLVDDVTVAALGTLANAAGSVDFVRMGVLGATRGAAGMLFWDEYESRRDRSLVP